MDNRYLDTEGLPFCKGCSHHLIARATQEALEKLDIAPLDVVIVTDIGCHGIIDGRFTTHTVHGLHGRSIALGAGIAAALADSKKKVIVFIGDGGTTIGMNHLIGAAHRNIDMTVIVHNNMLYGMTGGQRSDLTPGAIRTRSPIEGYSEEPLDIISLTRDAKAAFTARITARGDFSDTLAEAMLVRGFSLVEVLEICPAYGMKENKDLRLADMEEKLGLTLAKHLNENAVAADLKPRGNIASLFDRLEPIPVRFSNSLKAPMTILLGGSAGEGVQSAADIFALAAVSCGLEVSKKGHYPVTVGTGFSAVEMILSPDPIEFAGTRKVGWTVVSSLDGSAYLANRIGKMKGGSVLLDSSIGIPDTDALVRSWDFRGDVPARDVNLLMLFTLLEMSGIFPAEALARATEDSRIGAKTDAGKLMETAKTIRGSMPRPRGDDPGC